MLDFSKILLYKIEHDYCTILCSADIRETGPKGTARAQRVHSRPTKTNACFSGIEFTRPLICIKQTKCAVPLAYV